MFRERPDVVRISHKTTRTEEALPILQRTKLPEINLENYIHIPAVIWNSTRLPNQKKVVTPDISSEFENVFLITLQNLSSHRGC